MTINERITDLRQRAERLRLFLCVSERSLDAILAERLASYGDGMNDARITFMDKPPEKP